jgi:hypothetical protein
MAARGGDRPGRPDWTKVQYAARTTSFSVGRQPSSRRLGVTLDDDAEAPGFSTPLGYRMLRDAVQPFTLNSRTIVPEEGAMRFPRLTGVCRCVSSPLSPSRRAPLRPIRS